MNLQNKSFAMLAAAVLLALTGCGLFGTDKPIVIIESPPSGSQFHEGETISVQSASTDSKAVVRVELLVDGNVVDVDPSPTAKGQPHFTLVQQWKATQGQHTLLVRAYNAAGQVSDPAGVSITVITASAQSSPPQPPQQPGQQPPTPTFTPTTTPTATPTATPTTAAAQPPQPPPPPACANNSAFVSETIPDGTSFNAGQAFTKKWTLSNNGTCAWGAGYQFVFVTGEAMSPSTVVSVPATAVGGTAELSVAMIAPATPGTHVGKWQMRSGATPFGQVVNVTINVPAPLPPPVAGCSGTPNIASFTADKTTIIIGTNVILSWGAVTNADTVEIDNGIGGVAAPGSRSVFVSSTKTFVMTAKCKGVPYSKQVTIKYSPLVADPGIFINPGLVTALTFHVASSSASVFLQNPCFGNSSQSVTFVGNITVNNNAGTLKYRWEYSDGTNDSTEQVTFSAGETKQVYGTHSFASSGWGKLNFISPDDADSNKASFTKSCVTLPGGFGF